jgi:hypothetical protein
MGTSPNEALTNANVSTSLMKSSESGDSEPLKDFANGLNVDALAMHSTSAIHPAVFVPTVSLRRCKSGQCRSNVSMVWV